VGFSKCSVMLFLRQLFTRDYEKPWLLSTIVTMAIFGWTVVSTIVISVNCAPYPSLHNKVSWKCGGDVSWHYGDVALASRLIFSHRMHAGQRS